MISLFFALRAFAAPPAPAPQPAAKPAPESPLEAGRAIYVARCQACHGPKGQGDGPAARALPNPPADLSSPAFWKNTDEDVIRSVIASGRPGTVMRGFPMPDDRQDALVTYLKSLSAP